MRPQESVERAVKSGSYDILGLKLPLAIFIKKALGEYRDLERIITSIVRSLELPLNHIYKTEYILFRLQSHALSLKKNANRFYKSIYKEY